MQLDEEKAGKNLKVILEKIHNDTDSILLSKYSKIYKKEISVFKRSWVAAWLFMQYDQKEHGRFSFGGRKRAHEDRDTAAGEKSAESSDIFSLGEEESKRLFVSIGKNRRLFPREIITFILAKTTASREDIGLIRILDNYSFVQVRDTKADEIIQAMNGVRFRGRTLAVNYAKPKNSDTVSETAGRPGAAVD